LGNGDWTVQVIPVTPYSAAHIVTSENHNKNNNIVNTPVFTSSSNTVSASEPCRRRIITVTKLGMAYLIQLDITDNPLDIRPRLARFVGGMVDAMTSAASSTGGDSGTPNTPKHALLSYDVHRDWVWLSPPHS
jgi:hypothetical protein